MPARRPGKPMSGKNCSMEVSKVKRLKELERENEEIKKIIAEQALDIRMLKDVNSKKW